MILSIDVPEYDNGLRLKWEDNFSIECSADENAVCIKANREGLISLARHLLELAQDDVPIYTHIHLDEFNSLDDNSTELIITKKASD